MRPDDAAVDGRVTDAARDGQRPLKPRLRGVSHAYAFFVSLVAGVALVAAASGARAVVAASVYAVSLSTLFAVSALYHVVTWSVAGRRRMRRLDHSTIFLLIAGTYTPFGLLVLPDRLGTIVLAVVWSGALLGVVLNLFWITAPKWFSAIVYVSLGWVAVAALPALVSRLGATATGLLVLGGVLYSAGAVVYALRRPDPVPAVFGYHEVFHALVIAAAIAHYIVVASCILGARATDRNGLHASSRRAPVARPFLAPGAGYAHSHGLRIAIVGRDDRAQTASFRALAGRWSRWESSARSRSSAITCPASAGLPRSRPT
jgi:hemolysin III